MLQVTLVSPRATSVTMLQPTHSNLGIEFQACVLGPTNTVSLLVARVATAPPVTTHVASGVSGHSSYADSHR